ncbi:sulfotransferase family protein [Jannaschia sp. CCS1]|uniref:sulfotransferase family protein n=1 Tax=Jannaschia sp. (strain CCS1) TaxID=290400 RepID=UPI000053B0D6|nr:sulfotransferase family protein [Jannaschia sp. CCS1]ABD56639.1 hypothetical protein Jann_3722 [Jannaschia sp. CCS1]
MTLQIIGTGLSRTGTMSTRLALQELGFGPCHHMMELFADPDQVAIWTDVARNGAADWNAVFAGYNAQVDFPGGRVWTQTIEAFPEARVVHTERPEEDWWASFSKTVLKVWANHERLTREMPKHIQDIFVNLTPFYIDDTFGGMPDKEMAIAAYRRTNREVRETVAPDRLLVFTPSDGWGPLCDFLHVPVPNTPFPRSNGRDEFWSNFDHEPADV